MHTNLHINLHTNLHINLHTNLHINLHTKWRINLHTWLAAIEPRGVFRQCSVRDGLGRAGKFGRNRLSARL